MLWDRFAALPLIVQVFTVQVDDYSYGSLSNQLWAVENGGLCMTTSAISKQLMQNLLKPFELEHSNLKSTLVV